MGMIKQFTSISTQTSTKASGCEVLFEEEEQPCLPYAAQAPDFPIIPFILQEGATNLGHSLNI